MMARKPNPWLECVIDDSPEALAAEARYYAQLDAAEDFARYAADRAEAEAAEFAEWAEIVDESAQAGAPIKINRAGERG